MNEFSALVFMHGVIGGRSRGLWIAGLISVSRWCVSSSKCDCLSSLNVEQTVELVEIEACAIAWRVKIGACIGEAWENGGSGS